MTSGGEGGLWCQTGYIPVVILNVDFIDVHEFSLTKIFYIL